MARLGDTAYGVTVRQEIQTRTGRDVSIGAIDATLARLEAKGLARRVPPNRPPSAAAVRNGSSAWPLTAALGHEAQRVLRQMVDGLEPIGSYT